MSDKFFNTDTLFIIIPLLLIVVGYLLVFVPVYLPYLKKWQLAQMRKKRGEQIARSELFHRIAKMLELSFGKANVNFVYVFIFAMVGLFILTGAVLRIQGFSFISAFVWAFILPAIVIAYLKIRIFNNRVKVSYEGLYAVTELTNNYRVYHRNLAEALEHTEKELVTKAPLTRDIFLNMVYRLRDAQNEHEIRFAVDYMVDAIDTSWARQLANLFKIALIRGDDITEGLIEIQRDLGHLDELGAQKKRLNLESRLMIFGLLPMLIIGSVIGLITMFDFTFEKYIEYQFRTPIGFKMFFFVFVTCGGTFLMYKLFTRSKNDY